MPTWVERFVEYFWKLVLSAAIYVTFWVIVSISSIRVDQYIGLFFVMLCYVYVMGYVTA